MGKPKTLLEALIQTQEIWEKKLRLLTTLQQGECPLCRFFNNDCSICIVQDRCNSLRGCSFFNGDRTLFGKIVDARDKTWELVSDAVLHLGKLVEKEESK